MDCGRGQNGGDEDGKAGAGIQSRIGLRWRGGVVGKLSISLVESESQSSKYVP